MAGEIIVGKDCLIWHIILIWKKDPGLGLIYNEWLELATALEIPFNTIQQLKQNILFGQRPFTEILHHIISTWVGCHGQKIATVQNLIKTLKEIDLFSYAESLETAFRLPSAGGEESDLETNHILKAGSHRFSIRSFTNGQNVFGQVFHNLLYLLRSLVDITPFRSLNNTSEKLSISSKPKGTCVQKLRKMMFIIVCCITVIISLIDLLWESYNFDKHVKGTNKVDRYIAFFRKLGTTTLRFAFLYLGYYKVDKFAEKLDKQYPNDKYKTIFTSKHCWISKLSLLFVTFLTSSGLWMPPEYFQNYSEIQKIAFLDSFADFSENYQKGLIICLAIFRFFLMIVEQYALDLILVVAIILNSGFNTFMDDVKKHFNKIDNTSDKNCGQKAGFCCCLKVLRSNTNKSVNDLNSQVIPLQNSDSTDKAVTITIKSKYKPITASSSKVKKNDMTTKLFQLRYDYRELRTIFRSTNDLIGVTYIISLFIGLLLVSSLEDTLLNSKVNIIDKLEYAFIFGKMCGIVYIGCSISFTLEKLHGEEYTGFFSTVDIPNKENGERGCKHQKDNQSGCTTPLRRSIKRKQSIISEDFVAEDFCWLSQPVQRNPIGLGNHPFTMNVKFLARHLGLALFTIFLGIVSTRSDRANDNAPSGVNPFLINGSYYECSEWMLTQKPVEL